jgi:hypothetical protein
MENLKYFAYLNDENTVVNILVSNTGQPIENQNEVSTEIMDLMVEYIIETEKNLGSTQKEIDQKITDYLKNTQPNSSDEFNILQYSLDNTITNNRAEVGYTYNTELNAFIPPKPDETYILNYETFAWEPNPELSYDLHGDDVLYKYNKELNGWTISET